MPGVANKTVMLSVVMPSVVGPNVKRDRKVLPWANALAYRASLSVTKIKVL